VCGRTPREGRWVRRHARAPAGRAPRDGRRWFRCHASDPAPSGRAPLARAGFLAFTPHCAVVSRPSLVCLSWVATVGLGSGTNGSLVWPFVRSTGNKRVACVARPASAFCPLDEVVEQIVFSYGSTSVGVLSARRSGCSRGARAGGCSRIFGPRRRARRSRGERTGKVYPLAGASVHGDTFRAHAPEFPDCRSETHVRHIAKDSIGAVPLAR
jgi:hypothetical protein